MSEQRSRTQDAPPKKSGALRRVPILLLVLLAVLGVVAFAAFRDIGSVDSLRRLFTYNKVTQDADGRAEAFRYESDRGASYTMLDDALLSVSQSRILLLNARSEEVFSLVVNLKNPAVAACAGRAAVYDVGGKTIYLLDRHGLVRDMSGESGSAVLSASLNDARQVTLVTLKSGYRSAVSVYDASGEPVFTFNSSDRYVMDACTLNDGRHLAAVTLGEADGAFASTLTLYSFESETPVASTTLNGAAVLSLGNIGGTLAALEDDRLTFFDAGGSLRGSYRFDYPYLRGQSAGGSDFAVLLLSRYRSGSSYRLVSVGQNGEVRGTLDVQREVVDVSAAGRYVAVLYSDSLTLYTPEFEEYATLEDTGYARSVFVRADGTALLLGATRAWLYIP